jgi:hypothetical protein
LKQKKLPVLRDIQYGPPFFLIVLYLILQPLRWNSWLQNDRDIREKIIIASKKKLSLAVFIYILNKLAFKWYKIPTMLLEKVSIHTEIIFVHFLCLWTIVYYCLKVSMNLLCSCVLYMYGFDFLSFFPRFLLLVIKGQFFTEQKLCFRVHFF